MKGYRMCPEWVLDMLKSTVSSNRSRVPEIESIEYWKAKSQPINIESAAQNRAAQRFINKRATITSSSCCLAIGSEEPPPLSTAAATAVSNRLNLF
jgi:hypothetical protein